MHKPKVGAECSSETTTVSPFFSFFMAVGTFHSWENRQEGTATRVSKKTQRRDRCISPPLKLSRIEINTAGILVLSVAHATLPFCPPARLNWSILKMRRGGNASRQEWRGPRGKGSQERNVC